MSVPTVSSNRAGSGQPSTMNWRQRLPGVERHVAALGAGADDVEPASGQALGDAVAVRGGRDEDARAGGAERRAEVVGDAVEEVGLALVELDGMAAYGDL